MSMSGWVPTVLTHVGTIVTVVDTENAPPGAGVMAGTTVLEKESQKTCATLLRPGTGMEVNSAGTP